MESLRLWAIPGRIYRESRPRHLGWNQEPSYCDGKPRIEKTEVLGYSGMEQYIELSRCESKGHSGAVLLVYYLCSYSDMKV
jgi:hypothetical protein